MFTRAFFDKSTFVFVDQTAGDSATRLVFLLSGHRSVCVTARRFAETGGITSVKLQHCPTRSSHTLVTKLEIGSQLTVD
jgi:hypothetical protein